MARPEPIIVGKISSDKSTPGVSRVVSVVDGEPFWYESPDSELAASPEGFANALMTQAMMLGRDIVFEDPLCDVWLKNAQKVMEMFSGWFGWKPVRIEPGKGKAVPPEKNNLRVLCFSGGGDSFYSLLTYPQPIDKLVLVHGYDIRLQEIDGGRFAYEHTQTVAAAKGIGSALFRTNFLDHHIAGRKYRYSHGGALAAVGFLIPGVSELVISSGFRAEENLPDGSHWQLDPLRASAWMKIVHYGSDLTRDQKLRVIATDPLLRKHLRICQENRWDKFQISSRYLNCGRCFKCIRAMMVLQQEIGLDDIDIFENKTDLDVHLYDTPSIREYFFATCEDVIQHGVEPKLELSLRALMRRSRILVFLSRLPHCFYFSMAARDISVMDRRFRFRKKL